VCSSKLPWCWCWSCSWCSWCSSPAALLSCCPSTPLLSPRETMTQSHHYNYARISLCPAILPSSHPLVLLGRSHSGCFWPDPNPSPTQTNPKPNPILQTRALAVGQSMADGLKCSASPLWFVLVVLLVLRLAFSIRKLCWRCQLATEWARHGNRTATEIGPGQSATSADVHAHVHIHIHIHVHIHVPSYLSHL